MEQHSPQHGYIASIFAELTVGRNFETTEPSSVGAVSDVASDLSSTSILTTGHLANGTFGTDMIQLI